VLGDGDVVDDSAEALPDCSGDFGDWAVLFEDPGWSAQALAPSSDGLEFFYARLAWDPTLDDSGTRLPVVRTRTSLRSNFGEPTTLWDLATACEGVRAGTSLAGLDLSVDGKRLYLVCSAFAFEPGASGPLLMFERTGPFASFDQPPAVVGEAGISLGLTRDELQAFGTSLDPSLGTVLTYRRGSLAEPFGAAEMAPGAVALSNPEPAPDNLALLGVVPGLDGLGSRLGVARYNIEAGAYESPVYAGTPPPEGTSDVSPALSGDCREIYMARQVNAEKSTQVVVARR
jgi:hypothetical protein